MFWCRTPTLGPTASARTRQITWCGRRGSGGRTRRSGAGRLIEPGKPCMKEKCAPTRTCAGNLARFEGLSLTLRHPELFDVKALHISPSWTDKAALRNRSCLPTSFATKIAKRLHKVTEPKHRPHNYYARFKMNLHFFDPVRSTTGVLAFTPSPRLEPRLFSGLWSTDAVVLIWKHAAVEHYYRGLAHGTTHLDVDLASAAATAREVLKNQPLVAKLKAVQQAVVRDLICPSVWNGSWRPRSPKLEREARAELNPRRCGIVEAPRSAAPTARASSEYRQRIQHKTTRSSVCTRRSSGASGSCLSRPRRWSETARTPRARRCAGRRSSPGVWPPTV